MRLKGLSADQQEQILTIANKLDQEPGVQRGDILRNYLHQIG
jgi:hypothetical protein